MTSLLALSCRLAPGESVPSFTARLAQRNGVGSAREFCLDMGMTFQACIDGEPVALAKLARLTALPLEVLEQASLRREGIGFRLRGESLTRFSVPRARIHACPACLRADLEVGVGGNEPAPYGRTEWLLRVFRACPVHACALTDVGNKEIDGPHALHDFALHMRGRETEIARLADEAAPRTPSALEGYVRDRLEAIARGGTLLDGLELHAAITTCEMLGVLATRGPATKLRSLTEEEWHDAGDAGYCLARGGERGIRALLDEIWRAHPFGRRGAAGPHAVFGFLYEWLAHDQDGAAFDAVRDIFRQFIVQTIPVGLGDDVLGQFVKKRELHSIYTASREYGHHPKRLRKVLAAAALIGEDHQFFSDHLVTFDAERARSVLVDEQTCMPLKDVAVYLNAGRVPARILAAEGFITPRTGRAGERGTLRASYATADLDTFLAHLFDGAESVTGTRDQAYPIPAAAKRACCTIAEVTRLIFDRRLAWVGRQAGVEGYLSVLVDLPEVKRHVHGPAYEGMTAHAVEKILRTSTRVVTGLIREGFLPRKTVINPINRCPVDLVSVADLDAFCAKYVSFSELAKSRRVSPLTLKYILASVPPAIERDRVGAAFYLREIVEKI
ncbi:TniQ family protein [Methylobacterium ajmalii]|uniref:TniQ family protein n=1 Tax=Methylobacterium ajmalii TaxID=2738439 RepID=A0ABU9ZZ57_9HYPH